MMRKRIKRMAALLCAGTMLVTSVGALSVEDAREILEKNYIYELPAAAQSAATLDELFSYVTDAYTYYMDAEQYAAFLDSVEGKSSVTGIGASIAYTDSGIELLSVLPGGSAEEAGLTAGDLIISVEGVSCIPAGEEHRALLLGEEGTSVRFTVKHTDGTVQDYTLTRRTITVINTNVSERDGVGYIDCDSFGSETGQYFLDGIRQYDSSVRSWIVDLRGNTGGIASSAVTALGAFLGSGALLYYKSRSGSVYASFYRSDRLTDSPAIVLTNGYSASGSEIFAGGLAGCGGGIVVGSRTYGKGVAQQVFDESSDDRFDGDALKVTVYRFYCADGNTTDLIGVIPTLTVSDGQAKSVAELLCGVRPTDGSAYLHLVLNGCDFYVVLKDADTEVLSALLSALAPDAELYYCVDGIEFRSSPARVSAVCSCTCAPRGFSDVSESPYADEINTLAVYDMIHGNGDGTFRPDDTMTRGEICALLAQAIGLNTDAGRYFTDVDDWRWFAAPINAMASLNLVYGIGGGKFSPYSTMTQREFLTVMGRFAEYLSLDAWRYAEETKVSDLSAAYGSFPVWARKSVSLLNEGITDAAGKTVSMLFADVEDICPTAPITRGQAAATMYRVLKTLGVLSY